MPWMSRPSRRQPARLRQDLRRWRYDHSQAWISFWIGAAIVALAVLFIAALRLMN